MNKSTKIWLNYLLGAAISLLLLYSIYGQVARQLGGINADAWKHTGPAWYLWWCIALMFVNTSLEGYKWYTLVNAAEPVSYSRAFSSYLAGVAFSIVTPNRIGEYPGRILYLRSEYTWRYIHISVSGVISQLCGLYVFGLIGLVYYNIAFPAVLPRVALASCSIATVFIIIIYQRFDTWVPALARIKWLQRLATYGRLPNNLSPQKKRSVLGISILRTAIFTAQYLFLLRWMNVGVPLVEGYCMAALFYWILAVIPGVALVELGIRGWLCIFLFHQIAPSPPNTVGMLGATIGIWLLNLIVPSVLGSILIVRMRLLR